MNFSDALKTQAVMLENMRSGKNRRWLYWDTKKLVYVVRQGYGAKVSVVIETADENDAVACLLDAE